MRNLYFNLIIGALTLSIGIWAGASRTHYAPVNTNYTSLVDKRLADTLYKVYVKDAKATQRRRADVSEKYHIEIKTGEGEPIQKRIFDDLSQTNENCRIQNLSRSGCDQMKELAIRDIKDSILKEDNILK